mgnify:CR=1 FL=1
MTTLSSSAAAPSAFGRAPTRLWHRLALAGILALAALLHFYQLDQAGFGNQYYAAAVASMRQNWSNFFFVAFDPAGFVSVDKPPLGLWVQVWSTQLLGFSGWSVHFPQALAGVLSVALVSWLVRRVFGPTAGVLAALILALTPISVAADRNNTMDSQLVLTSLLAAGAASLAAEKGQLRWLLASALLVGIGFNIKMLQAVLVLPAVFGVYLLTASTGWLKRLAHLTLASGLLAVVSLAWPLVVDLTPPDQRPYVGSSQNNTVMELIIGHNGAARLGSLATWLGLPAGPTRPGPSGAGPQPRQPLNPPAGQGNPGGLGQRPPGANGQPLPGQPANPPAGAANAGAPNLQNETGTAGPLRLFNPQLAGQASWFLPLALVGALTLAWQAGRTLNHRHRAGLLWALWLVPQVIFFSYAGLFHRYYLEMLSPAIAALAGAGLAGLWHAYRNGGGVWPLLMLLALAAVSEAVVIVASDTAGWAVWLLPLSIALVAAGALGLLALRGRTGLGPAGAFSLALGGLLIGPALWSATPVWAGGDVALPYAGPALLTREATGAFPPRVNAPRGQAQNQRLVEYLTANRGDATYLAATLNANTAAPLILQTGEPVMALGGFSGSDPILTETELADLVAAGTVRFFLVQGANGPNGNARPGGAVGQAGLTSWVAQRCPVVPAALWQPPAGSGGAPVAGPNGPAQLFDCATTAR